MNEAGAFSGRVAVGLGGFGVVCFVAFVVVLAFFGGRNEADGQAHALSRSAVGFAGVVELLRATGSTVQFGRGPVYGPVEPGRPTPALLVLAPTSSSAAPATTQELGADAVLIVLPKWRVSPAGERRGWVESLGLLDDSQVVDALPKDWARPVLHRLDRDEHPVLQAAGLFGTVPSVERVERLQTIKGPGWTPVLQTADGGIVLAVHARDGVYVLADPDLLNDLALAEPKGAADAVALLTELVDNAGPITFDVSLNGFGRSRDLLRLMFEPPLLGATLCGAAAATLLGLLSLGRFGPVQPPERALAAGKRALADNAAALIGRARREPRMARPYAELVRRLAARMAGAPRHLTSTELEAYLDAAGAIRAVPERFTTLSAEADGVRDRAALVTLARRLHDWRQGMVHGHR